MKRSNLFRIPLLRALAEWLISRSIDESQAIPTWVENQLEKDDRLRRFYHQAISVAGRLRANSAVSLPSAFSSVAVPYLPKSPQRRSYGLNLQLAAMAACLLLIVGSIFIGKVIGKKNTDLEQAKRDDKEIVAIPPVDRELLNESIANGRNWIQRWKERSTTMVEPFGRKNPITESLQFDSTKISQTVEQLGSDYGRLLVAIDDHVEQDRQRWITEGRAAWSFFAQKLPTSAGRMIGLK